MIAGLESYDFNRDALQRRAQATNYVSPQSRKNSIMNFQNEIQHHLELLKRHADLVEYSIPMLNFKTDDEIRQIKRYVIVYYLPLLSKLELE